MSHLKKQKMNPVLILMMVLALFSLLLVIAFLDIKLFCVSLLVFSFILRNSIVYRFLFSASK